MSISNLPEEFDTPFSRNRGSTDTLLGLDERQVLITNPIANMNYAMKFEHDFLWEASEENPFFVAHENIENPLNLTPVFYVVELKIHNRSGADDNYSWTLFNNTTGEVLEEKEDFEIPNKAQASWHVLVSGESYKLGDQIVFYTTKGKLGTEQQEPIFGEYGMNITTMAYPSETQDWLENNELE
jgi:hypothetical protein